jgi:hypothetical protein
VGCTYVEKAVGDERKLLRRFDELLERYADGRTGGLAEQSSLLFLAMLSPIHLIHPLLIIRTELSATAEQKRIKIMEAVDDIETGGAMPCERVRRSILPSRIDHHVGWDVRCEYY